MVEKEASGIMNVMPDLGKVMGLSDFISLNEEAAGEVESLSEEAKVFLEFYEWCSEIKSVHVGMFYPGILGVFLFSIVPSRNDVDNWLWVIVGDLPPAYITIEDCPNPASALDGYVGAMYEWVNAAFSGESVATLIPVNVPATKENAEALKARLQFIDERILSQCQEDLTSYGN